MVNDAAKFNNITQATSTEKQESLDSVCVSDVTSTHSPISQKQQYGSGKNGEKHNSNAFISHAQHYQATEV